MFAVDPGDVHALASWAPKPKRCGHQFSQEPVARTISEFGKLLDIACIGGDTSDMEQGSPCYRAARLAVRVGHFTVP